MTHLVSICFLGIDGSGKSSLAKHLCEELKHRDYNVSYVWWLRGNTSLVRRTLKAIGSSRYVKLKVDAESQKVVTADARLIHKAFRWLFPVVIIADYLRFGIANAWLPKLAASDKVIIFDRFMYDVILALSEEFELTRAAQLRLLRFVSVLLPKPDLVFLIEVPPEVCYIRKKDEINSMQEARRKWEAYQLFSPLLDQLTDGRIVKIDNTKDLVHVNEEILATALQLLGSGARERETGDNRY
jgi:thymidylate kinase